MSRVIQEEDENNLTTEVRFNLIDIRNIYGFLLVIFHKDPNEYTSPLESNVEITKEFDSCYF